VDVVPSARPRPCVLMGSCARLVVGKRLIWGGKAKGQPNLAPLGLTTPAPSCTGARPSMQPRALLLPPCRVCVRLSSAGRLGQAWEDRRGCSNLFKSPVVVTSLLASTSASILFKTPKLVPKIPVTSLFNRCEEVRVLHVTTCTIPHRMYLGKVSK